VHEHNEKAPAWRPGLFHVAHLLNWGGWIRTTDLLINSQALCQLSYTPSPVAAGAAI
jgi:hypothetical protein